MRAKSFARAADSAGHGTQSQAKTKSQAPSLDQAPNHKHQISNKDQNASTKSQTSSKSQAPNLKQGPKHKHQKDKWGLCSSETVISGRGVPLAAAIVLVLVLVLGLSFHRVNRRFVSGPVWNLLFCRLVLVCYLVLVIWSFWARGSSPWPRSPPQIRQFLRQRDVVAEVVFPVAVLGQQLQVPQDSLVADEVDVDLGLDVDHAG